MKELEEVLPEPLFHKRPKGLPKEAVWLSGEGAGSWFCISISEQAVENSDQFYISRYSPSGTIECEGCFTLNATKEKLNLSSKYSFGYPSHCAVVTIIQGNENFILKRIELSKI